MMEPNTVPEDWNDLTEDEKQNLMSLMAGLLEKNAIKRTDRLELLVKAAWHKGISKVHPCPGHRNSDIALIIIADTIEDSALKQISCIKYSKSYRFSIWGWSSLRLMAYEVSSGRISCNRLGRSLKNLVSTKGKK